MYNPNRWDRQGAGDVGARAARDQADRLVIVPTTRGDSARGAGRIMKSPREVLIRPIALSFAAILLTTVLGSTLAVAGSFASALAAAYVVYPPQLSIWINDPSHVAELGFIVLLAITASKAVSVIIDGKPLGSWGARAASRRM